MEKLIYVIWKDPEEDPAAFRDKLLGAPCTALRSQGAKKLAVSLVDEHVEYGLGSRITSMENPIAGFISFWLDTHLGRAPCEEIIQGASSRAAGYLVLESTPIVNTTSRAALGARTPGINTIGFLKVPEWMSYDEWREVWQGSHTQVAIETQSTFLYIQNVVVRALTEDAPLWAAFVEEGFPKQSPLDPHVFYASGGSQEKLEENLGRMITSVQRFIELPELESHLFSQYIISE